MPIVVVLVCGLFWRRGTADGAFWTLVTVVPLGLVGFLTGEILELHPVQFLYATGIMLLISLAFFVVISLRTEAPDPEDIQDVVFDKRNWRKESEELKGKAWYANYRILALALVVLTVGVVIPLI
jgi:SSS family solute:Na+ symporter